MNERDAFEIIKNFLRKYDDDDNPTNSFYHEEELKIIEKSLNELQTLHAFAKFVVGNSKIWVDVLGYQLECWWLHCNVYIPNGIKDMIKKFNFNYERGETNEKNTIKN